MVGQYLRMRSKYASIEMAGTFRAWKHSVAFGDDRATDEAEKRAVRGGSNEAVATGGVVCVGDDIGDEARGVLDAGRSSAEERLLKDDGESLDGWLTDELAVLCRLVAVLEAVSSARLLRMKLLPLLRPRGIG